MNIPFLSDGKIIPIHFFTVTKNVQTANIVIFT